MKKHHCIMPFLFGFSIIKGQETIKQADNGNTAEENKLVKVFADDIYVHIKGTGKSVVFISGLGEDHDN
jgi:hypothetical protein